MHSVAVNVVPFHERPSTAILTENVSVSVVDSKLWKIEAHMLDPLNCIVCFRLVVQFVIKFSNLLLFFL